MTAKDAGKVLQMAGMGAQQGKLGALTLKGTASGTPTDIAYDVNAGMAGIGFQGAAKGTANGIGAGIPKINSTFDIKAKDLGPIAALAGMPADAAKQVGAVSFSGQAQSGADDLTYDVVLALAGVGGKGTLKGKVTGLSGTPQVDTALNLTADKPAPLLRLAGIAGPKAQSVGKLGIAGTLKGSAEDMKSRPRHRRIGRQGEGRRQRADAEGQADRLQRRAAGRSSGVHPAPEDGRHAELRRQRRAFEGVAEGAGHDGEGQRLRPQRRLGQFLDQRQCGL